MSSSVTSIFTFKIESTFEEWAAIFDSAEADKRHSEFLIKPLFRGVSKKILKKLLLFIRLQMAMFKSLLKLMVIGWQRIESIFQLWKNILGLIQNHRKLIEIKK